jgi:hypothetical protein
MPVTLVLLVLIGVLVILSSVQRSKMRACPVFLFWPKYGQTLGNVTPPWYFMTVLQDRIEVTFWP